MKRLSFFVAILTIATIHFFGLSIASCQEIEYITPEMEALFIGCRQSIANKSYKEGYENGREFLDKYGDSSLTYDIIDGFFVSYLNVATDELLEEYASRGNIIDKKEALKLLRNYLLNEAEDPHELFIASLMGERAHPHDRAYLKKILDLYPNSTYSLYSKYILVTYSGNFEEAAMKFLKQHPKSRIIPKLHLNLAKSRLNKGDSHGAREYLETIMNKYRLDYYMYSKAVVTLNEMGVRSEVRTLEGANKIRRMLSSDRDRLYGVGLDELRRARDEFRGLM